MHADALPLPLPARSEHRAQRLATVSLLVSCTAITVLAALAFHESRILVPALAGVLLAAQCFLYVHFRRSTAAESSRRARELEKRTRELEERTRELEAFCYSVSHDLRAPLRAISGFAQILLRRHRERLDEQGRHYFDNIVQASAGMGRLIDDLLAYSRLGRSAVQLRPVPLQEVLEQVRLTLRPRIEENGAHLEFAPDLPPVLGDWTLLGQIFTNLLNNALTYRKPGVPPRVKVTWQRDDGGIVVRVADNGIGIAPNQFERIFEVFRRLHTDEEYPGTGIGLAVVKRALEPQGGRVHVESQVGAGSVFSVRLQPAAQTS